MLIDSRVRRLLAVAVCLWLIPVVGAPAQETGERPAAQPAQQPEPTKRNPQGSEEPKPAVANNGTAPGQRETEGERYARLRRGISETEKRLEALRASMAEAETEYGDAELEAQNLEQRLEQKQKELQEAQARGSEGETAKVAEAVADLEKQLLLAREQLDLNFRERKTLAEQIGTLEKKLQQDRQELQKLGAAIDGGTGTTAGPPAAPAVAGEGNANTSTGAPVAAPATAPAQTAPTPAPTFTPGTPLLPQAQPQAGTTAAPAQVNPEVAKVKQEAEEKERVAQAAEQELADLDQRIETVRASISAERKLLTTARERANNAQERQRNFSEQARKRWAEGADQKELQDLWAKSDAARADYLKAQKEIDEHQGHIDRILAELDQLQSQRIAALKTAEEEREAAEEAKARMEVVENPWSWPNVQRRLATQGPRIVAIIFGAFVLLWSVGFANQRITRVIAERSDRGSVVERENRARTLVQVFHNATTIVVVGGALLMVLTELGFDLGPVLGGAAVIGLAVAFGAQNLVRDYFSGFMILLENQYGLNDVVKLGSTAGLVERVTLRVTVLRDLEGIVHFIPNGEIKTVSNMTHGWSRALFDIGVAYKEDVNRVMEVLMGLGNQLREDPEFKFLILEPPEMLGVDQFGDSAVMIKFFIKTRPLQQWKVKREMNRRIKMKFDELGIEIPFPHRTVYYGQTNGAPSQADEVMHGTEFSTSR